jgi:hypothetical protein
VHETKPRATRTAAIASVFMEILLVVIDLY